MTLLQSAPHRPGSPIHSGPTASQNVRILWLEDSRPDAELAEASLAAAGLAVLSTRVDNAAAFVSALQQGTFDLIVSDYSLPGFDGARALAEAQRLRPELPFLCLSGTVGEETVAEMLHSGATDFVLKHHLARLAPAVRRALREARERRSRLEAEQALQASQQFLQQVFEASPTLIVVFDLARRRIAYLAGAVERTLGHSPEQVLALGDGVAQRLLHPEDLAQLPETLALCQSAKPGDVVERVARLRHADGSWRSVSLHATVFTRGAEGRPERILLIGIDVTERTRLHEQFLQSQKMEAVGRLAGGIAHDFNNLLGVILGYGGMVLARLDGENPLRAKVAEMVGAGERAALLTRQLLTFSRKQVVAPTLLDLNAVIGAAGNMIRRLIGEQIDVRLGLGERLGSVRADPGQIDQIVMNLVVNARDAMPSGGKLTIETCNAELDATYAAAHSDVRPGRYVMLAVTDTGTGMSPEVQRRLFEPFFTTKGPDKGTGLGLATVYGIVKQSQGHIWVYSEPGHGTTFKVYLPRLDAPASVGAAEAEAPRGKACGTILLVEDEPTLRELTEEVLSESGYQVLVSSNANEALAAAERHAGRIDLLLSDLVLPGLSGHALWQRLQPLRPEMKAVFMSGYPDDAMSHHEMLPPGVGFLQKPFSALTLERKLREFCGSGK